MRLNYLVIVCTLAMFIGTGTAQAGKAERDLKKKITAEKLKPALKSLKEVCKCAAAIKVDWKAFQVKKNMDQIKREIDNIDKTVGKFCKSDEESRALYCKNVKSYDITFKGKGSPETVLKGKNITIRTTKDMNSGGYELKRIIEKF